MWGCVVQFEEMYEQRRKEVNKTAEKFEKQLKAAKRSGNKANQDKARATAPVRHPVLACPCRSRATLPAC